MNHRNILLGLAGVLFLASVGVFVLITQGTGDLPAGEQLSKESLVAGVAVQEEQVEPKEADNTKAEEVEEQAEQGDQEEVAGLLNQVKQPNSAPQPTSAPAPEPSPAPESAPQPDLESAPEPPPPAPASSPQPIGKVNINTASSGDLQQLEGIGPVLAARIIDYRKQVSLFYKIEDVQNVSGIGEATYANIKNDITVGSVGPAPQPSPSPPAPVPAPSPAPAPSPQPEPSGKININTAKYEELREITGVGEVIARRIIDYRNENGLFRAVEEIKNVSGIGDVTFEKMKSEITI